MSDPGSHGPPFRPEIIQAITAHLLAYAVHSVASFAIALDDVLLQWPDASYAEFHQALVVATHSHAAMSETKGTIQ